MHTGGVVKNQKQLKKIYSVGRTENHNWFPWSFPKVKCDSRCASKEIHWCQTSSNWFFFNRLDKNIGIDCTVQKTL